MMAQKNLKDPEIKAIIVFSSCLAQLAQIIQHLENPCVSPALPRTRNRAEVKSARGFLRDKICRREKRRKQEGKLFSPRADATRVKGKEGSRIGQGAPQTAVQI